MNTSLHIMSHCLPNSTSMWAKDILVWVSLYGYIKLEEPGVWRSETKRRKKKGFCLTKLQSRRLKARLRVMFHCLPISTSIWIKDIVVKLLFVNCIVLKNMCF